MTRLSVNVNKFATLRNSRGKNQPNLIEVVDKLIHFQVKGITVHPRPDGRHILYKDVLEIKNYLYQYPDVEFNIEGYPSDPFLTMIQEIKPHQCTLVPDPPSALTSEQGWKIYENLTFLKPIMEMLKKIKVRSSLFLDPFTFTNQEASALKQLKPDRAELYTQTYAKAYLSDQKSSITKVYQKASGIILNSSIKLNAGHDLNSQNLSFFLKKLPTIEEVSIGHALICEAIYEGLETTVKKYLSICEMN